MSGDGIFHIDPQGRLFPMIVTPYDSEETLQSLLAEHPDLLAGGHMTPDEPRRWLLLQREQGIADHEDGAYRWSIDHLFVDQDGIPTLVEVKRSSDTRIRREVVGQMLDYAANGVRYWRPETLRALFESDQERRNLDPAQVIAQLTDDSATVDQFFALVDTNMRSGRIRMVFVADVVPDELRAIVEFLNGQLNPAEMFAVEVKQYRAAGHDSQVIVPAVYGRTALAAAKTSSSSTRTKADRATLMEQADPAVHWVARLITELASEHELLFTGTPRGWHLTTSSGHGRIASLLLRQGDLYFPLGAVPGRQSRST